MFTDGISNFFAFVIIFGIDMAGAAISVCMFAILMTLCFSQTSATNFGVDDTGVDVTFFGATAGRHVLWDEDQNRMHFLDNTYLAFGGTSGNASTDMQMYHTGNSFTMDNNTGSFTMDTANNSDFIWKHNMFIAQGPINARNF